MTIAPTVGRIVWFHPEGGTPTGEPHAAKVAAVNEDGTINLGVIDHNGVPYAKTNVFLRQEGEANPFATTGGWAQWMPFQVGQAAKAAAAPAPAVDLQPVHDRIAELETGTQARFEQLGEWLKSTYTAFEQKLEALKNQAPAEPAPPQPQQ